MKKSQKHISIKICMGTLGEKRAFDLSLWNWRDGEAFFHYSTERGREPISSNTKLRKPDKSKWENEVHLHFSFNWKDPWNPARGKKEGGFLWSIWHKAIIINASRAKM